MDVKRDPRSTRRKWGMGPFWNPNLNWTMLYNAETNDIFNLNVEFWDRCLAFSTNAIWSLLIFFQKISFALSCIIRSNWRVNERRLRDSNGLFVIGLGLNFSWSYDIARKDERNFSINVWIKLIFEEWKSNTSHEKVIDI